MGRPNAAVGCWAGSIASILQNPTPALLKVPIQTGGVKMPKYMRSNDRIVSAPVLNVKTVKCVVCVGYNVRLLSLMIFFNQHDLFCWPFLRAVFVIMVNGVCCKGKGNRVLSYHSRCGCVKRKERERKKVSPKKLELKFISNGKVRTGRTGRTGLGRRGDQA